jgi:predicted metalloprotease
LLLGVDPRALLQDAPPRAAGPAVDPAQEPLKRFVSVVLADTEDVWHALFRDRGLAYREPRLVLFSGRVQSACGLAGSAVGPFYCAEDASLYIDLEFFDDLHRRFGAPGDFAQAYVVAHEVGHHVQNLLGRLGQVHAQRRRLPEPEANRLSVRLELQADYLAGVWAHHAQRTKDVLEPGDLEEALRAASAIGDDRLQRRSGGDVAPDTFTHGTSEQRLRWFRRGFDSGSFEALEELFTLPYSKL